MPLSARVEIVWADFGGPAANQKPTAMQRVIMHPY